jgi:acetyl-CoA C-acetyltransferase
MAPSQPIYIVDGVRTPFLKARNRPGPFAASDLATDAGRALLLRQPVDPTRIDEVILGCAAPSPEEVNIARVASLRMGCGEKVPAWTVMRNCASGMQAMDAAMTNILAGRSNLVLAGGVDALSRAPLLYSDAMVLWLANWYAAKTIGQKAALTAKFRPAYLAPVIGLMKGLTDPIVGLLPTPRAAISGSWPRSAPDFSTTRSCRSTTSRARSTLPTMVCARTRPRRTLRNSSLSSIGSTAM